AAGERGERPAGTGGGLRLPDADGRRHGPGMGLAGGGGPACCHRLRGHWPHPRTVMSTTRTIQPRGTTMYSMLIVALLASPPARNAAESALWVEREALQRELSEAAEPLYKNVGPLMKQYIAHEQEERESLQDKMQTVAELVRIADTAAPLGARVA